MQPSCTGKLLAAQLVLGVFVVLVLVAVGINRPVLPAGTIEQSHSRLSDEPSSSFEAAETYRLLREETGSVLDTSQATPDADSPFRGDTSCSRGAVPPSQAPKQHQKGVYIRAHRYGDLSALRQDRNPWDPAWDNGIAICACMFQENTTDVREWLLYHKYDSSICRYRDHLCGVHTTSVRQHIYNSQTNAVLRSHPDAAFMSQHLELYLEMSVHPRL